MGDAQGAMAAEHALAVGLELLAAALAAWLVLSTVSSVARRLVPRLRSREGLDRWTAPIVRRLLDALLCGALGAGLIAGPATAATTARTTITARATTSAPATTGIDDVPVVRVAVAPGPVAPPRAQRAPKPVL